MNIDLDYILDTTVELLGIPSPVGFTDAVMNRVGEELNALNVPFKMTKKEPSLLLLKEKTETTKNDFCPS